ncbi:MAG: FAD-dependent oxidoreductase [Arenicellaceae bacterium]|nr:FAD-dependent oxidoreductase [Arenicellaceae bacterium]
MKILFLAPQPFYIERGTPIAIDLLLKELSVRAHQVHLLTFLGGQHRDYAGLTIQRLPDSPANYQDSLIPGSKRPIGPGFSLAKVWLDVHMLFAAWRQIFSGNYDLVHAVEEAGFIAWLLKKRFGTPYIYDMDSLLSDQVCAALPWLTPLKGAMRWLESRVVREACVVAPMCEDIAHFARAHRSHGIHLVKDVALFDDISGAPIEDLRNTLKVTGEMILYVGNLEGYQGIDLLLEASQHTFNRNESATLVIVGGSRTHIARYTKVVESLGISSRVRFAGTRPVEHLADFLCQADILVSARSQGTNTPMKIYSYLYAGVVTVATRLPTHTQVLNDENSKLADANAASFGDAMLAMLEDKQQRLQLGAAGHKYAKQSHSQISFKKAVGDLYEAVGDVLGMSHNVEGLSSTLSSQLVIAGGGITGASIALRAASQGYSVTLVEKDDFGGEASANNLRTIHGGLRYLQTGDIFRSRMSAQSQNEWIKHYPYLLKPLEFFIASGPGILRSGPIYRLGLWFYHVIIRIGLVSPWNSTDKLRKYGTAVVSSEEAPGGLSGIVAFWQEAQIQYPERGVLAQVLSAQELGANCVNYQNVIDVQRISSHKFVVDVVDQINQQAWSIHCNWFIDATGTELNLPSLPSDLLERKTNIDWVKGVNLVFNTPPQHAAAWGIDSVDKRRKLFICPWQNRLVAGTWYFEHQGGQLPLLLSERELMTCINDLSSNNQPELLEDALAHIEIGLLPARSGKGDPDRRLLSHSIIDASSAAPGYFKIAAVKYTTAENIAEQVLDKIKDKPEGPRASSAMRYGSDFGVSSMGVVEQFRDELLKLFGQAVDTDSIDRLIGRYGSGARTILEQQFSSPDKSQCIPNTLVSLAEIDFVLANELVKNLSDLVIRRTDIGAARLPDRYSVESLMDYLVQNHSWDDASRKMQISEVYDWFRRVE